MKVHSAGRASGGCLYGFKRDILKKFNLKFVNLNNHIFLSATFNNTVFHLIPKYLNCTKWNSDFETFEAFLSDLNSSNFCIMGDLNARIGEEQILDKNQFQNACNINCSRNSKDQTINGQGKKLLEVFDNIGGVVLNGRTMGDPSGDYTFCGVMGNSVIDYCVGSCSILQFVNSFSIGLKPFSDHMPLYLKLEIPANSGNTTVQPTLTKLRWNNKFANQYNHNLLSNSIHINCENSSDKLIQSLTNKIKDSHKQSLNIGNSVFVPKQKWFNWRCFRLRKTMLKNLKDYRNLHTPSNRNRYNSAKHRYLNYCSQLKLKFYNENLSKLDSVSSSKQWWDVAKSMKTSVLKPVLSLDATIFSLHFSSLLNYAHSHSLTWCMPYYSDPFLDSPIEMCELVSVVSSLKSNKSPGPDGIPYEFYKYSCHTFLREVLIIFNFIFLREKIPESFKESIIIPLFKKGDPNIVSNYRGLSLINTNCKIFNNILLHRLTAWLERNNILNEFQAGFRRDYSTVDNIFNLVNIVKLNNLTSKYTFAFFVDFSCAFDTIPRNSLFYKLSTIGISSKIVRLIQSLYDGCSSVVWDGQNLSEKFNVDCGVKQGCILSPILFSLYLNDLPNVLSGGVNVANTNIKILLYADDIVLLSDSADVLQIMINELYNYCNTWSLKVNLSKSKILIFRKSNRAPQNYNWSYGDEPIETVNKYTYLGVNLTFNLSFKSHLETKLSAAKMAISSTWSKYIANPKISQKNKMKIFNAAAKSILLYAAQIWGFESYEAVEKLLRFFVKKMFYLPSNTPNYVIHLETNYETLFLSTIKQHFCYINRVLSLSQNRLPKILAVEIINLNIFWATEWNNLCARINYRPSDNILPLCHYWSEIIEHLKNNIWSKLIETAKNSQFHDLYPQLNHNISNLLENLNPRATSLVIKARSGLLNINARCFKANTDGNCTICNLGDSENTFHFIGVCPAYRNIRRFYLGQYTLNYDEVITVLNGSNFNNLYWFLENSLKYRNLLVNEFNI